MILETLLILAAKAVVGKIVYEVAKDITDSKGKATAASVVATLLIGGIAAGDALDIGGGDDTNNQA